MLKVPPLSRKQIRNLVLYIKDVLNIDKNEPVDVLRLLEHVLPRLIENFEFEVVDVSVLGDEHGRTYPKKNLIQIREDVYEGALKGEGRDRLTIMHEIGHLFLHDNVQISYARRESIRPFESPEWQASCFAGEFLMPVDSIKKMTIDQIVNKFKVSHEAARYQKKYSAI